MLDGIYYNPTTIYFGKNAQLRIGEEVKKYSQNILLLYGKESFKKYGLYEQVTKSLQLEGIRYIELGGVKSNPSASLVYAGITLCRKENLNFILAIGGGSVIDSAKAISIGTPWPGDFFDFFEQKTIPKKALKVATILTIAGSGSESSPGAVITHEEKKIKKTCDSPLMAPVFSILNPEITLTVPKYHTSCGIADAISHVLERYFTNTTYVDCSDRICEGLIKTLMRYGLLVKDTPDNYDVRAEIMWACKLAHDNTAGFGRKQDWSAHKIAHGLGVRYDIAHGAALSVIFPAWMKYVYKKNMDKFAQFAKRVFDVDINSINTEQAIALSIDKFSQFLKTIGMPLSLREMGIQDKLGFSEIAEDCVRDMPSGTIGNFVRLSPEDIVNILEIAH
jgi:alcohol dehydrogenase YqhD (iron-dependent ADH family)